MSSEKSITQIFASALKLQGEQRLQYLERACGADKDLRKEVESLLEANGLSGVVDKHVAIDAIDSRGWQSAVGNWDGPPQVDAGRLQRYCDQNRHLYDPLKYPSCPYCALPGDDGRTVPLAGQPAPAPPPETKNVPLTGGGKTGGWNEPDSGVTVGPLRQKNIDPVVGWLVCVGGPDRGRDYRIRSLRNFVGRGTQMDICIAGDSRVSRSNHAVVTYDPRGNAFMLSPGEAHGLTYLNGEPVDRATPLRAYDLIEVGETRLLFQPLCGDRFRWE